MSVLNRLPSSGVLKCPRRLIFFPRLLVRSHQTKPKNIIKAYLLDKYVGFVKSCEKALSKNFPTALKYYHIYSVGIKLFKEDVIILYKSHKKAYSEGWESLSRKELEIYYQMPKDIFKATTVIAGTVIPFCGFIFVLAFYFPRQLLTHHFWSLQQRSEFSLIYHKKKLQSFKPVLYAMQNQLVSLKQDEPLYEQMKEVLGYLSCGMHPSVDLILQCKPLFEKHYHLSNLSSSHLAALLKMYSLHKGWRRKQRLEYRASLISLIDAAIIKEGGFDLLTQDEIKWNCFLRGLNPINMRQDDILKWMNTWLEISKNVDKNSFSLLLHCPVLLGYNQPSNMWLCHEKEAECMISVLFQVQKNSGLIN